MPQSLSKVYTHIAFSTKSRLPMITDDVKSRLWEYLGGICKSLECNPVQIGGHHDHVHILCLLSRKVAQATLIEELKKSSSRWVKLQGPQFSKFYWQEGYGIFSVNPTETALVVDYIKNQAKHHETRSFQDEFRLFLKKYNVEYDEKYVWD